jgi:hypothetical protein
VAHAHPSHGRHEDEIRVWHRLNDEFLAGAREQLGPAVWERAMARGAALGMRDILDLIQGREPVAA